MRDMGASNDAVNADEHWIEHCNDLMLVFMLASIG